jgi:hypothetical protein
MNSAPAELLHLLVHAALQPLLVIYQFGVKAVRLNDQKKRRQINAGVGNTD